MSWARAPRAALEPVIAVQVRGHPSGGLFVLVSIGRDPSTRATPGRRVHLCGVKVKSVLGSKSEGKMASALLRGPSSLPGRLKRPMSSRIVRAVAGKGNSDVRRCSRNGCRWPASASLTYAYAQKVVWIEDLTPQPHPAAYDLCAAHAELLAVAIEHERVRTVRHLHARAIARASHDSSIQCALRHL